MNVVRGKPAEYGQEIVKRRFRITKQCLSLKDKVLLDFGCGNGAQTIEFLSTGCKIIAVDIDYNDLCIFKENLKSQVDSIILLQYGGSLLPIQSNSVDVVVSYEVIEHVSDESFALREMYRVLKPHGDLVISVPNKGWVFETHGANLPLLPWNRVPFFSYLPYSIHRRFAKARIYRRKDIKGLLEKHSFEILDIRYISAPMDVVNIMWLKKLLRAIVFRGDTTKWSLLSTSILVHCRRI